LAFEKDSGEWVEPLELEVVGHFSPGFGEELFVDLSENNDAWAWIEAVSLLLDLGCLATDLVSLVKN
jgi:hypothetical protein